MTASDRGGRKDAEVLLRRSFAGLAALGIAGTAVELAAERHWNGFEQLIPWAFEIVALAALALLVVRPRPATLWTSRMLAVSVLAGAPIGIRRHVVANYNAGPLDAKYTYTWQGFSEPHRWWLAISGGVGPSPILASGVLALTAVCLLCATLRHPRLPGQ